MMSGAAIGSSTLLQHLPLAQAHAARRLDHVAVDLAHGDVAVGQDRRDAQRHQRQEGRPEAQPQLERQRERQHQRQQRQRRQGAPELATLIARKPPRPVCPNSTPIGSAISTATSSRHRRQQQVLADAVGDPVRARPVLGGGQPGHDARAGSSRRRPSAPRASPGAGAAPAGRRAAPPARSTAPRR